MNIAFIIFIGILFAIIGVFLGVGIQSLPTKDKLEYLKKWLVYMVTEAEQIYGEKTGPIKFGWVFEQFRRVFPKLSKKIDFETFSAYVDDAIKVMDGLIAKYDVVKNFIYQEDR